MIETSQHSLAAHQKKISREDYENACRLAKFSVSQTAEFLRDIRLVSESKISAMQQDNNFLLAQLDVAEAELEKLRRANHLVGGLGIR